MKIAWIVFLGLLFTTKVLAKNIYVKDVAALNAANATAAPGDVVILKNGVWASIDIKLTCTGTAEKPIIFKAEKAGAVSITGKSSLRIGGEYIVVEGLYFKNGYASNGSVWEFRQGKTVATNCRISNCFIESFNSPVRLNENYWIAFYGKNNRLDHCSFINKTNLGVLLAVILEDDRSQLNSHSIDNNYFGKRQPLGSNGGEIIRVGVSQQCTFYSNSIIHDNLFEECDGEAEVISIKSCGNVVRNNVFKECQGSVVLRHGNNNTVEGNMFLGNGKKGTGGVRIINEGNWVVNNFFYGCRGEDFRAPLVLMNGVFNSPPNRYLPVRDAVVANNSFVNCAPISLGEGADKERTVAPANVYIINNIFYNKKDTALLRIYSSTDSIYFKNNIIGPGLAAGAIAGLNKKDITLQSFDAGGFPVASARAVTDFLPAFIKEQEPARLTAGFGKNIGATDINFYKKLLAQSGKKGISWNSHKTGIDEKKPVTVLCADAGSLYKNIAAAKGNIKIVLTGKSYSFNKPVVINTDVEIEGGGKNILFKSSGKLPAFFIISGAVSLGLKNINANLQDADCTHFITSDSNSNSIHFALSISQCSFSNLMAATFFNAQKNTYADEINITGSKFLFCRSNIFTLKDELDNKGYYNVEKMTVNNCVFKNVDGGVLALYRGGNDESTMGPKLIFTKNKIENSNNPEPLMVLTGVQVSFIAENNFEGSNAQKVLLKYTDVVKADHTQLNNKFENSGTITENKFVHH